MCYSMYDNFSRKLQPSIMYHVGLCEYGWEIIQVETGNIVHIAL